jgi:hypothetical protein
MEQGLILFLVAMVVASLLVLIRGIVRATLVSSEQYRSSE